MIILDYISIIAIAAVAVYVIARLFIGWRRSQSINGTVTDEGSAESGSNCD